MNARKHVRFLKAMQWSRHPRLTFHARNAALQHWLPLLCVWSAGRTNSRDAYTDIRLSHHHELFGAGLWDGHKFRSTWHEITRQKQSTCWHTVQVCRSGKISNIASRHWSTIETTKTQERSDRYDQILIKKYTYVRYPYQIILSAARPVRRVLLSLITSGYSAFGVAHM